LRGFGARNPGVGPGCGLERMEDARREAGFAGRGKFYGDSLKFLLWLVWGRVAGGGGGGGEGEKGGAGVGGGGEGGNYSGPAGGAGLGLGAVGADG